MSWIEAIAVIFGLLCVGLTIRQNIWCWPTGLVQVLLYIVIFYQVKLYSDLLLHVVYVGLQLYGWHHWRTGGQPQNQSQAQQPSRPDVTKLAVTQLGDRPLAGWIFVTLVATALWGWGMGSLTDATLPYWDAFTTVASLSAQWLMTRKRLESWLFWIAVDVVAIAIYFHKSLWLTSGLYGVFLVMAIAGYRAWRHACSAPLRLAK
jgi:nicotinamide mononucleotide transporter